MFEWNKKDSCGVHKTQEHDMILVVSRWLPSGHGAWVRQMVVRARRSGWSRMVSWSVIYPAEDSYDILTCKNGYKVNAAGNDCEPIDWALCERGASFCSGWTLAGFDENTMVMDFDSTNACYQYRCRENGYAFNSPVNRTCTLCTKSLRGGMSPADGTCVTCGVGTIFDADAATSGYCVNAVSYSRQEMLYGRGQTKSTNPKVSDQCWPVLVISEYKDCVEKGGRNGVSAPVSNPKRDPGDEVVLVGGDSGGSKPPVGNGSGGNTGGGSLGSGGGAGSSDTPGSGGGVGGNKFNKPIDQKIRIDDTDWDQFSPLD